MSIRMIVISVTLMSIPGELCSAAFASQVQPLWSRWIGGSSGDHIGDVAIDGSGNVIVVGLTYSSDFPTTLGAYQTTYSGDGDAFVSKLSPNGSVVWSTFLGGFGQDEALAVVLDGADNPVVTGYGSVPATPGAYNFPGPTFVAKLSSDGSSLIFSATLGGEFPTDVDIDGAGNPVIVGFANASFPTTPGAYMSCSSLGGGGFVAKLSVDGSSLLASTCTEAPLGAEGVAVDQSGHVVVVGQGGFGVTAARYDQALTSVLWRFFDGGQMTGVALDGAGNPVVVGYTFDPNFPTTPGAYDRASNDSFVAKLSLADGSVIWGTFLGGGGLDGSDIVASVALDGAGLPVVAGHTKSPAFPLLDAFDGYSPGDNGWDSFAAKLSPDGGSLIWSTFLGGMGRGTNYPRDIDVALDGAGRPIVAGGHSFFPSTQPPDGFVLKGAGTTTCLRHDGSQGPQITMEPGIQGGCQSLLADTSTEVDAIRGNTESLTLDNIGVVTHLVCDSPISFLEDDNKPSTGRAFFYLMRRSPTGSYSDGEDSELQGSRTPSSGDCP